MAEVGEQLPALADHLQQPPPGVHVLLVRGEVLGELSDALREQRDLDFRRAGIPVVPFKLAHDLSFHIFCQRHTLYPHLTVTHKKSDSRGAAGGTDLPAIVCSTEPDAPDPMPVSFSASASACGTAATSASICLMRSPTEEKVSSSCSRAAR